MTRSRRRTIGIIALSILGVFPACDGADRLESITSPTLAYSSGSNSGPGKQKQLIKREQALASEQVVIAEINPSGGQLTVGGHTLVVPKKAVERQTVFYMRLVPGDYIHVQLFAWDAKTRTPVTQFKTPVKLLLSYADAQPEDANKLDIAYLPENNPLGRQERVNGTWVDTRLQTVLALLPHFSEWVMVID
jgi:hypothetical protein